MSLNARRLSGLQAVQTPVYRNSPQAEVYRIFPTLEQMCPFHQHTGLSDTEQFTSTEHNSFQHSLGQQRPAPLPALLLILYHFNQAGTPVFLQQGHVKLPLDLKIHLGFLKMMQPQTLILEFLFCISFLETPTNTSEHLSRGF